MCSAGGQFATLEEGGSLPDNEADTDNVGQATERESFEPLDAAMPEVKPLVAFHPLPL